MPQCLQRSVNGSLILITGSAGFLGPEIVRRAVNDGLSVIANFAIVYSTQLYD